MTGPQPVVTRGPASHQRGNDKKKKAAHRRPPVGGSAPLLEAANATAVFAEHAGATRSLCAQARSKSAAAP